MNGWQDVRFATRLLVKRRWFTAVAVVTYAIGIGAATAIYSVVDALLVRPLPYTDSDRIVQILSHRMENKPVRSASMARPHWVALRDRARTLSAVGAYDSFSNLTRRRLAMTVESSQGAAELLGTRMSAALFSMLGTPAEVGRVFQPADERPGQNDVIVLSHRVWQTQFGSDPQVLGKRLTLDRRAYAIIGVMPQGFRFPDRQTDFWIPLTPAPVPPPSATRTDSPNSAYADGVFARLEDGITPQAAAAEVESILRTQDLERASEQNSTPERLGFPRSMPRRAEVVSMKDELIAPARPLLRVLSFAVLCVLLIAGANVVNLLLAGAASRQQEMATRLALGAGRLHLIRQSLVESVLLSLSGGVLGIPLAYWAIRVITALAPADLPRIDEVGVNMPLLLYALALSSLAGLAAGLVPALRIVNGSHLETVLRQGTAATVSGFGFVGFGVRRLLVIGEIALAVMLLACAGLLIRSFVTLNNVSLGYDARHVLTFQVIPPYGRDSNPRDFYVALMDQLGSMPGVEAAGATDVLPIAGASSFRLVLGGLPTPPGPGASMVMRLVSPNYFRAMGIRVVGGRSFSESASGFPEVLLNQEFARRYFGNDNPIGRIVGQGLDTYEVVGIVADVRHAGLHADVQPEYYMDLRHSGFIAATRPYFVVRSPRTASELVPAVRTLVRQIDPQAGVGVNVAAMADIVSESVSRPRFNTVVLSLFAALAVALAAIAVYGVMAYAVAQRTREIGVRVALGARRVDVMTIVLRQSALMTGAGILLGLAGGVAVTRYLQGLLFGVTPLDLTTFVAVSVAFAGVATLASYVPAHRATKVDPVIALRAD